ncbi:YciI family protein [Aquimarina addita]|uniref:YciI family protein n=1 Tax=Aquimarina addita TaxID=870485 RepID=A0ABP7X892_9FLAO
MKEFMFIIRGGDEYGATLSPEELQAHMKQWEEWMGSLAQKGKLVGGQPLISTGTTIVGKEKKVIDRPFAEGKELVGGYIIAKADSIEEATEIAKGCPSFEWDCSVEVREINLMGK